MRYCNEYSASFGPSKDDVLLKNIWQSLLFGHTHPKCDLGSENFHVILRHSRIHVFTHSRCHGLVKFHKQVCGWRWRYTRLLLKLFDISWLRVQTRWPLFRKYAHSNQNVLGWLRFWSCSLNGSWSKYSFLVYVGHYSLHYLHNIPQLYNRRSKCQLRKSER